MITDGKKLHYLAAKEVSALLTGIRSNNNRDFYRINFFHTYRTENKSKKYENVCKNHDYYYTKMSNEHNEILKYNHGEKCESSLYNLCYICKKGFSIDDDNW